MAGSFNGRAKLSATGTSVADIAGSATGELMVVLAGGRFSNLLVELIGLDIAESLGFLVEGDRSVPVRCIVADFAANQGVFDARTLVFDTTDTNVVGSGQINMRDEVARPATPRLSEGFQPADAANADFGSGHIREARRHSPIRPTSASRQPHKKFSTAS